MNVFTTSQLSVLTDIQKALLILLIEKRTGNKYPIEHVKKHMLVDIMNEYYNVLTKAGQRQLKNISKKLLK